MYKRQAVGRAGAGVGRRPRGMAAQPAGTAHRAARHRLRGCLLYTSDAADERSSVDLGGRRIIKKKKPAATRSDSDTDKKRGYTEEVTTAEQAR